MATTTNYGWTTPDDTALVKDGASAIRTLGSSVDTTTKALNPSTTLGDIEYRSSTANTNTRLGIGSTGNVLTVAGGVPTWAAPSGGKSFSLLNTTSMTTGTEYSITSLSGNDILVVNVFGASIAGTSGYFSVRFNSDSAANYAYAGIAMNTKATNGIQVNPSASAGDTAIDLGYVNAAASVYSWTIIVQGCNSTGPKPFTVIGGGTLTTDNNNYILQGIYSGTSVISSAQVRCSSSTSFDAGTIKTYGAA